MEWSVLLKSILFDANCIPFTVAFILLMSLLVIEIFGFLVAGMGIFALIDNLMPEIHMSHDFNVLHWAKHKNVPVSIWLAVVLSIFSVIGLGVQAYNYITNGTTINPYILSVMASIPAILIAKWLSDAVGSIVFVDHTIAVTVEDLVGCKAKIVIGVATKNRPAECKIIDSHGKPHYMMCIPLNDTDSLSSDDGLRVSEVRGTSVVVEKVFEYGYKADKFII